MISVIRRTVELLRRRIHLMIGRAVLSALADGSVRQRVQFSALKGEVKADVERVQDYGFTSHPLPGAQIVFVSLSGNRDHPLVIRADEPSAKVGFFVRTVATIPGRFEPTDWKPE